MEKSCNYHLSVEQTTCYAFPSNLYCSLSSCKKCLEWRIFWSLLFHNEMETISHVKNVQVNSISRWVVYIFIYSKGENVLGKNINIFTISKSEDLGKIPYFWDWQCFALNNIDITHCKRSLSGNIQICKVNLVNCYLNLCAYRTCQNPSALFPAPCLAKANAKARGPRWKLPSPATGISWG